jgi:hypothetical protein
MSAEEMQSCANFLFLHAPAAPPPSLRTHARMKPNLPLFLSARFQHTNVTAAAAYAGDMAELAGLAASLPPLPLLPPWLAAAARVSWLVACVAAVALALLALLRANLDNGGVIPLGKRCEPGLLPSFGACCDACAAPRVPAQAPTTRGQPHAPVAAAAAAPARRDGAFCAASGSPFVHMLVSCALTHPALARRSYYARRWVSPTGATGERVQKWLQARARCAHA